MNAPLLRVSLSYVSRYKLKTALTVLAVTLGVATFSAIRSAHDTLTGGIRATVDRMAGKAHLQITMEGGVPEEIQEKLREMREIRATAPVIEQIVVPVKEKLGSVLVLGVDLLGDREMRDYGFEGSDADVDDPLLFLAQPDSVVMARPLAQRAGIKLGDSFTFRTPLGERSATVRGFLTPKGFAEAFGGNLIVTDVYAAQHLFGRGRNFDRLEVRLAEGVDIARGRAVITAALGPAFETDTPDRRGEGLERMISGFTAGFRISSLIAMGIGSFLIYNAFQVAVTRRRRDIGTLKSLGATPGQIELMFLAEAAVIGFAGGAAGLFLGAGAAQSFFGMMGKTAEQVFGVASSGNVFLTPAVAAESMFLGVAASLMGALKPARDAGRVKAVEAFAKGRHQASSPKNPALRAVIGTSLIILAVPVALYLPLGPDGVTVSTLLTGCAGIALLTGPLARLLLRYVSPVLAVIWPVSGRLASDALRANPRRTSGTVMATTLSLAFVLGVGGHMGSTRKTMVRWMDDVLTSDLYLRASANFSRPDFRYPGALKDELLAVPGVRAVESFRNARIEYGGERISLASIEIGPMMDRTRREFLEGTDEDMRTGLTREGKCVLSDNFARRFGLGAGSVVTLPSPTGLVKLPVAAVTRDLSNDRGTIYIDREVFLKHWKDDRVDVFDISVTRGTDPGAVRENLAKALGGRYPALISTRAEFTREITAAVDEFFALVRITLFLALLIACLGIASSLLISVAERTGEIGILKALGALPGQIGRSVVMEGVLLSLVGLALAVPFGDLMALFMEKVVAVNYSGWVMPHYYPWGLLAATSAALPAVAALSAWLPARQAAKVEAAEAISYE